MKLTFKSMTLSSYNPCRNILTCCFCDVLFLQRPVCLKTAPCLVTIQDSDTPKNINAACAGPISTMVQGRLITAFLLQVCRFTGSELEYTLKLDDIAHEKSPAGD